MSDPKLLATLPTAPDAEAEVARRLRRVAKALPRTSMPSRRSGGAA